MILSEIIEIELNKSKKLLEITKNIKVKNVNGRLEITGEKTGFRLLHVTTNNNEIKKRYINKDNIDLAKNLAKKSYLNRIEKILINKINILKKFLKDFKQFEIEEHFEKISPARKQLLGDVSISYQQHLKAWKSIPYNGRPFLENSPVIITKKGERVRSKSEKILADLFYDYGIEYKYECPVYINNRIYYPDFTFLCPYTLKEIYWEHHGLMDNIQYCNNTITKLKNYEKNGIVRGENLIVTYETKDNVLDLEWVNFLIQKHLLTPFTKK